MGGGSALDSVDVAALHGFHDIFKQFIGYVESGEVPFDALLEMSLSFQNALRNRKHNVTDTDAVAKLNQMSAAWDLADIFFIRGDDISKQGGFVLPYLLKWVAKHYKAAETLRLSVLSSREGYEHHENYWSAIIHLACCGRMKEVSQMLQFHSEYPTDEFAKTPLRTMEELARRMPFYNKGTAIADFSQRWQFWKKHVVDRTKNIDDPSLLLLARLFQGEAQVFEELAASDFCLNWEELFVAKLLYTEPLVLLVNAGQAIDNIPEMTRVWDTRSHHAHNLLINIVNHEPLNTLDTATALFESLLFSSHFSFFLHQANWLSEDEMSLPMQLTLAFGKEIASTNTNLFHLAATYLSCCGPEGVEALHDVLLHVSVTTAKTACKLISVCKTHKLDDTARAICRQYASTLEGEARFSWLLKGCDYNTITSEVDDLLEAYHKEGMSALDVVKPFRQTTQCGRLAFAASYQHMLELREKKFFADSSTIIMRLLTASTTTPKWFWFHVLKDALPLLEHDEILFSAEETRALTQCLEEVMVSHSFDVREEEVANIRMALARNLARSIILDQR
eukprot:m.6081 g.6081  ORF g.6081 m.6081 type:complete len:564 (+) comp4846_c0_seq1:38-1729(+)